MFYAVRFGDNSTRRNNGREARIVYLEVEIEVIDGQPVLAIEGEEEYGEEYLFISLELPEVASFTVDGQVKELEVKNNAVLLPTEDGTVAVPIEDFCVVMVDGEVMLLAEKNPVFTIGLAILGAKYFPVLIGIKASTGAKIAGGTVGVGTGTAAGIIADNFWMSLIIERPWGD